MSFPASPLPNCQVLGADRRIPVRPPPSSPPHSWLGGHSHHRWRVESLSVAPRDASQHTRPNRLRRALPLPPQKPASGPQALPGPGPAASSEEVTRSGSRAEKKGESGEHAPPPAPVGRCLQLADAFVPPRGIGTQPPRCALGTMCCRCLCLCRRPRAPRRARTDDDRAGVARLGAQDSAATAATATSATALSPSAHAARASSLTPNGPGLPGLSARHSANHNVASLPDPAPRPPTCGLASDAGSRDRIRPAPARPRHVRARASLPACLTLSAI